MVPDPVVCGEHRLPVPHDDEDRMLLFYVLHPELLCEAPCADIPCLCSTSGALSGVVCDPVLLVEEQLFVRNIPPFVARLFLDLGQLPLLIICWRLVLPPPRRSGVSPRIISPPWCIDDRLPFSFSRADCTLSFLQPTPPARSPRSLLGVLDQPDHEGLLLPSLLLEALPPPGPLAGRSSARPIGSRPQRPFPSFRHSSSRP